MRSRYNAVSFLHDIYNRHPIARPWGRDMWCLLWAQAFITILSQLLQWCMHHRVLLHRVITALDCSCLGKMNMCFYSIAFLHIGMTQVFDILLPGSQRACSIHSQYHGCWWPVDTRSQGISSCGIYLIPRECFGLSTRRVKIQTKHRQRCIKPRRGTRHASSSMSSITNGRSCVILP